MIKLTVDGTAYEGWISATVERRLSALAHSFSLTYLDRWASGQKPWPIVGGAACVLAWKNEPLIDGYADRPDFEASGDSWTLSVQGRSRTGDLVDCDAVHETGHWANKTGSAILSDVCWYFGINVSLAPGLLDTEKFERFALKEGEKAADVIARVCALRGWRARTLPGGDLELYTAIAPASPIVLDVASAHLRGWTDDTSQRFSHYRVSATGTGDAADAFAYAEADDPGVARYRPRVIVSDTPGTKKATQQMADWECNLRKGKAQRWRYAFQNPVNKAGKCYAPGQRYKVTDPYSNTDTVLLVDSAILTVRGEEIDTRIELVRPEVYDQETFTAAALAKKTALPRAKRGTP